MHVHHGLHADADAWLAHAAATCARWARRGLPVAFASRRLQSRPESGDSVEAWARAQRYAALREMALCAGAGLVLLGHHRRDQAETFVLQALRGAGVGGLAAMPRSVEADGVVWARPWLDVPREAIVAYAGRHRLRHVDDGSNADPRYARNRLRLDVWPALLGAFPDAEASLAAASRLAGDAKAALGDATRADAERVCRGEDLDVRAWQRLPPARGRLVLVAWLHERLGRAAPRTLVERLAGELHRPDATRWPAPGGELRRRAGLVRYAPGPARAGR